MTEAALMDLAMDLGEQMIRCGAEITRVEESVARLIRAYSGQDAHVFSIPSNLLVSYSDAEGKSHTQSRRVLTRSNDLDRLDRLNALCRRVCLETPEEAVVRSELNRILERKTYSLPVMMLAFGVTAFGFTVMFGGCLTDALAAFIVGILLKLLHHGLGLLDGNEFVRNLACSFALVLLAGLGERFSLIAQMDLVIVGVIMTLVPGFTLTSSMRDFIVGDSIAGLFRLVEALLVSVGLAVGTALALLLLQL